MSSSYKVGVKMQGFPIYIHIEIELFNVFALVMITTWSLMKLKLWLHHHSLFSILRSLVLL